MRTLHLKWEQPRRGDAPVLTVRSSQLSFAVTAAESVGGYCFGDWMTIPALQLLQVPWASIIGALFGVCRLVCYKFDTAGTLEAASKKWMDARRRSHRGVIPM